jgi:hypothetical protein
MKENNWEECIYYNGAKQVTPDIFRSKSLFETSLERLSLINEINSKNCNYVFEDYYTSIIEILEAIAFKDGFNILNHVCLGFYLRDCIAEENLFLIFDDLRYKQNSLTYYGNRMDFDTAKNTIKKSTIIFEKLKTIYNNN